MAINLTILRYRRSENIVYLIIFKRMCGHRSGINTTKFPTVYQHLNQHDHSILSMKVRILE